jgi:hypothetical protein
VTAWGSDVDLPPAARARVRDGSKIRIAGRDAEGRILVEVGSRTRLQAVLDAQGGSRVAFAAETTLDRNVVAAAGARATLLWYKGDRLLVTVAMGGEYEVTCDALATAMPPKPREEGIAVTHWTRTKVLLVDESERFVAALPANYPVVARASEPGNRVPVTGHESGYIFNGFIPREALVRSEPDPGLLDFSSPREMWPYPASWLPLSNCSGPAVLRAGAVVRDGARALLTTTKEHRVKLYATRENERLVVLTDVDPAIEELIAWVDAGDLDAPDCAPAPPARE